LTNKKGNAYTGMAGHLSTMSQFCLLGYNAAIPEIDKGDDIFVVNDLSGEMWRVQVKTSHATEQKKTLRFSFNIREDAIKTPTTPSLHFVFACSYLKTWNFVVLSRQALLNRVKKGAGTFNTQTKKRTLNLVFNAKWQIHSGKVDFTDRLNNWKVWPKLY
jgi:hypothetical protein